MKKLIFILIMTLCLSFTACDDSANTPISEISDISYRCKVYMVKIDNHDYLVARGHGISIIHSESCPCKKNNK